MKFVKKNWKFSEDELTGEREAKEVTETGSQARALNR
jgi:hypothetical protein